MVDRIKKLSKWKWILFLTMALFLIWGLLAFRHYGISWDEEIQRGRGLAGLRTAIVLFQGEDALPDRLKETDVTNRGYGVLGMKLPLVLMEYATGFKMSNEKVFRIYHLYNFLIFFISVFFLYHLLRLLGFGEGLSYLGVLLYILCPRILAESFYNNKDLLFLSMYTICLCLSVSLVKSFTAGGAAALAVATALMLTVRTVGGFPVAVFGLYFLVRSLFTKDKKVILQSVVRLGVTVAGCFAVLVVLTPKMWTNLFKGLASKVSVAFSFSHGGYDMVMGMNIDRLNPPWYYLPLTIAMTVPCIYLIFTAVGLVISSKRALVYERGAGIKEESWYLFLLGLQFIFIVAYTMIAKPMQYNLWRHYYFIFVYMVIFSVYGIRELVSGKKKAYVYLLYAYIAVSLIWSAVWIRQNHPYEYLYFNPLFSGRAAEETVQDYWAVSYKNLLEQIIDGYATDVYIRPTLAGNQFFGQPGWENYHLEALRHSAKYRIEEGNPGDNRFYRILKGTYVNDRFCNALIRRENYGNILRKYYYEEEKFTGVNNGPEVEFNAYTEGTDCCILMKLPEEMKVSELDILYGDMYERPVASAEEEADEGETEQTAKDSGSIRNGRIYISDDGERFKGLSDSRLMNEDDILGAVAPSGAFPEYVLFKYEDLGENTAPSFAFRVFGDERTERDRADVYYNRYEAREHITSLDAPGARDADSMLDGREDTCAVFGNSMEGDEYIELSLDETAWDIRGLHIDCGAHPMGGGRDILIEASGNGTDYEEVKWYYGAADDYLFESELPYRYYRIRQKGTASHPWVVSELGLIHR